MSKYEYTVKDPWQWVVSAIATDAMKEMGLSTDLPSAVKAAQEGAAAAASAQAAPPVPAAAPINFRASSTRRRQRRENQRRAQVPAMLRLEKLNASTGAIEIAVHGSSAALDSLDDKDELVRTIQRCRCEHLNISPPAVLINWDVSEEECKRVLGESLPVLPANKDSVYAVLKEPMGSRGEGVFFVKDAEEIHKIITEHRQRAQKEPGFLDQLIAAKGRIPSWVLQAEVAPCLLIQDERKFHLRSYMVVVENLSHPDLLEVFIYNRHEVRMASAAVVDDPGNRSRDAHITNGSDDESSKRLLLGDIPELTERGMQGKIETFLAATFGLHLLPDMLQRVRYSVSQEENGAASNIVRKFAVAGLDMMVCSDDRIYLLEVNVNPSCPPEKLVAAEFRDHLTGFMQDLVDLIMERPYQNFVLASDILRREGLLE